MEAGSQYRLWICLKSEGTLTQYLSLEGLDDTNIVLTANKQIYQTADIENGLLRVNKCIRDELLHLLFDQIDTSLDFPLEIQPGRQSEALPQPG